MEITDGNLRLTFKDIFYTIGGPNVRGDVVIESIEPECCEVIIQGRGGKKGGLPSIQGRELNEKYT